MDDNNEGDNPISSATFEHGTYTGSSSTRSNTNNSNEQQKLQTQSSSEETAPPPAQAVSDGTKATVPYSVCVQVSSKSQEEVKPEKSTPPRTDTAVTNAPTASETAGRWPTLFSTNHPFLLCHVSASKPTPTVQQKQQQQQQQHHHHSIPAGDDDFEPSDVATTVVEATLADVRKPPEY